MNFYTIFFIALGLSMDAFAVSIVNGFTTEKLHIKHALKISFFFGGFQALMPILGWITGNCFSKKLTSYDHWIAFFILFFLGCKMIYEAKWMKNEEEKLNNTHLDYKTLILLSIATSIDAFAVGFSLKLLDVSVIMPSLIIGVTTFFICFIGVYLGKKFGHLSENYIESLGGIVLILIGIKILFDHKVFG